LTVISRISNIQARLEMRIAVFHNLPSGGAKRTLQEAVRRLTPRHHLDVFTTASANHEFADLRPFVSNYWISDFSPLPLFSSPLGRLNNVIRVFDLVRLKRTYRALAKTVDLSGYDVLFAQPCRYENTPSVIGWLQHTPAVFYCHEPLRIFYETMPDRPYLAAHSTRKKLFNRLDPFPDLHRSMVQHRDRFNFARASVVLTNSAFIQKSIRSIYGREARVSYHGVDTNKFRPLSLPKERFVLSVGSLTPLKGFDFLIRSIAKIPSAERPPLRIVSNFENPPERAFLQVLSRELHVELQLLGNISEELLVEHYNKARMVAYTPVREPFGLVPLEAMACGVPVVATREGGIPESVLHDKTGLLVARESSEFAQAVHLLLSNPRLASEYGQNGREHAVSRWSWDQAIATLEAHLSAGKVAGLNNPVTGGKHVNDAELLSNVSH
jgi:glycosyltransferase involved in cell wall biosynthesis